ncbi:MAG: rhodanese-like domain-containing protein [Planctomycetota bacterium]
MTVKRIDPDRAHELLDSSQGFVYVDVRTESEFQECHIPDSKNVPYMVRGPGGIGLQLNRDFVQTMSNQFDLGDKLILGCAKGGRSTRASEQLAEAGFRNIYDMRGGIIGETDPFGNVTFAGWGSRGLPTVSQPGNLPPAVVAGTRSFGGRR